MKKDAFMIATDVPELTLTDIKKSPNSGFAESEKHQSGVYITSRGEYAGVMLTRELYEELVKSQQELHERIKNEK